MRRKIGMLVRAAGIEPALHYWNKILSLACLPIPPRPQRKRNRHIKANGLCNHFCFQSCGWLIIDADARAHYPRHNPVVVTGAFEV